MLARTREVAKLVCAAWCCGDVGGGERMRGSMLSAAMLCLACATRNAQTGNWCGAARALLSVSLAGARLSLNSYIPFAIAHYIAICMYML